MNNELRLYFFKQILPLQALHTPLTTSAGKESDSGCFLHPFSPFLPGPVVLLLLWQKKESIWQPCNKCKQNTSLNEQSQITVITHTCTQIQFPVWHTCARMAAMWELGWESLSAWHRTVHLPFPYTAQFPQVFQGSFFFRRVKKQSTLPVQKATQASNLSRIRKLTFQLV